jgi:hypothetical protein
VLVTVIGVVIISVVVSNVVVIVVGAQLGFLLPFFAWQLGSATAGSPATTIITANRAATIITLSIRFTIFHLLSRNPDGVDTTVTMTTGNDVVKRRGGLPLFTQFPSRGVLGNSGHEKSRGC